MRLTSDLYLFKMQMCDKRLKCVRKFCVINGIIYLSMFTAPKSKPNVTLYPPMKRQYAVASTLSVRATFAQASPSCHLMMNWSKSMAYSTRMKGQRSRLPYHHLPSLQMLLPLLFPQQIKDLGKIASSFSPSKSEGLSQRNCP